MSFLLGVSLSVNIFLSFIIFVFIKFRKVVSLYGKFKDYEKEFEVDEDIEKSWNNFWSSSD